jgi:hypothetical protein
MHIRRKPRSADECQQLIDEKEVAQSELAELLIKHRHAFDGDSSGERIFEGTMWLRTEIKVLQENRAYLAKFKLPGE